MKSFLFYDVETSGLNPAFDQILTFACIRTDPGLNELSRELITVRLRPDIVPSPGAFLTHCLTPAVLAGGVSEYSAAVRLHELFNTPGTVSLGYNSLGFDDEFLRFLFYRNLLDPYAHQYANDCSRMDILPVAVIYRLFCDHLITWPTRQDGLTSLKLEHITRDNRFEVSGNAHEAMSDVEALLALTRMFARESKVWEYVTGFFDKKTEARRLADLEPTVAIGEDKFPLALMVSPSFGAKANYMAPVMYIGGSLPYRNQTLWVRLDHGELTETAGKDDSSGLFVIRKKAGDQRFILPPLERFWGRLLPQAREVCKGNLDKIRDNQVPHLLESFQIHREFRYPEVPDLDPDAALYQDGFFSFHEKTEIAGFHEAMAAMKEAGKEGSKPALNFSFQSQRIQTLAARVLIRESSGLSGVSGEFIGHLKGLVSPESRVVGYKGEYKLTCEAAMADLDELMPADLDPDRQKIARWLGQYIQTLSGSIAEAL